MPKALYTKLLAYVGHRCGYCHTSAKITGEALTIEHLLPLARGGSWNEENLWLACRRCNERKGTQIDAVDFETGHRVPLFNPRQQVWREHFTWSGDGGTIIGLTACGRATVVALQMNHPDIVPARRMWASVGWHPPEDLR